MNKPHLKTCRGYALIVAVLISLFASSCECLFADVITYLDLKQPGSCCVILRDTPEGRKAIIIDTGPYSRFAGVGGQLLMEYLYDNQVEIVELVILSHMDGDHVGGLLNLLDRDLQSTRHPPTTK